MKKAALPRPFLFLLIFDEEASQLLTAAWMPQLAQRLRFYLPDALARDVELLADFFQRVVGVHVDAEAHAKHLGFTRGQLRKYRVGGLAQRFHRGLVDR